MDAAVDAMSAMNFHGGPVCKYEQKEVRSFKIIIIFKSQEESVILSSPPTSQVSNFLIEIIATT